MAKGSLPRQREGEIRKNIIEADFRLYSQPANEAIFKYTDSACLFSVKEKETDPNHPRRNKILLLIDARNMGTLINPDS